MSAMYVCVFPEDLQPQLGVTPAPSMELSNKADEAGQKQPSN